MAQKIATFDSQTARTIAQFVRDQKRIAPQRLNNDLRITRNPRVIRWAKTCTTPTHGTYPTSGNVVMCQLGDYVPDTSTVAVEPAQTIDYEWTEYGTTEATDYVPVIVRPGVIPPENTFIEITRQDGQWTAHGLTRLKAKTTASISAGGSGTCSYYFDTSPVASLTAYWTWMDGGGGSIASGKEIIIEWYAPQAQWIIVASECA